MNLKDYIRSIPDYPKKGILFRDITTLIKDADAFEECINQIIERSKDYKIDKIAAIESRGLYLLLLFLIFLKNLLLCLEKRTNFLLKLIQLILN